MSGESTLRLTSQRDRGVLLPQRTHLEMDIEIRPSGVKGQYGPAVGDPRNGIVCAQPLGLHELGVHDGTVRRIAESDCLCEVQLNRATVPEALHPLEQRERGGGTVGEQEGRRQVHQRRLA